MIKPNIYFWVVTTVTRSSYYPDLYTLSTYQLGLCNEDFGLVIYWGMKNLLYNVLNSHGLFLIKTCKMIKWNAELINVMFMPWLYWYAILCNCRYFKVNYFTFPPKSSKHKWYMIHVDKLTLCHQLLYHCQGIKVIYLWLYVSQRVYVPDLGHIRRLRCAIWSHSCWNKESKKIEFKT